LKIYRGAMTGIPGAADEIVGEATTWPGVDTAIGSRGELSIRHEGREIGHLHGDRVAHFGFPRRIGAELRAAGRVVPHPVMPDNPGWGARAIDGADDVQEVLALLRLNYDRAVASRAARAAASG
jgi:hypothetical protein